jgi:hypothetical protein
MSNLLSDLKDEETINKFEQLEAAYDGQGIKYVRWSTKRFQIEQQALFAQGRENLITVNNLREQAGLGLLNASDNLYTVTNCDGLKTKSRHQFGDAVDYVILNKYGKPTWDYVTYCSEYRALRDVGTALGFNCGGSWLKQLNGNPSPYISVNLGWDPPHVQIG